MKERFNTFFKGTVVVVPLLGIIPKGESVAQGEEFLNSFLNYAGRLDPQPLLRYFFGYFRNSFSNITRDDILKEFKELVDEKNKKEEGPLLTLFDVEEFKLGVHIPDCTGNNLNNRIYLINFEEDEIDFCTEEEKVLYSINFDDNDFNNKLNSLVDHLKKINTFLSELKARVARKEMKLDFVQVNGKFFHRFTSLVEFRDDDGFSLTKILVDLDFRCVYLCYIKQDGSCKITAVANCDLSAYDRFINLFSTFKGFEKVEPQINNQELLVKDFF